MDELIEVLDEMAHAFEDNATMLRNTHWSVAPRADARVIRDAMHVIQTLQEFLSAPEAEKQPHLDRLRTYAIIHSDPAQEELVDIDAIVSPRAPGVDDPVLRSGDSAPEAGEPPEGPEGVDPDPIPATPPLPPPPRARRNGRRRADHLQASTKAVMEEVIRRLKGAPERLRIMKQFVTVTMDLDEIETLFQNELESLVNVMEGWSLADSTTRADVRNHLRKLQKYYDYANHLANGVDDGTAETAE